MKRKQSIPSVFEQAVALAPALETLQKEEELDDKFKLLTEPSGVFNVVLTNPIRAIHQPSSEEFSALNALLELAIAAQLQRPDIGVLCLTGKTENVLCLAVGSKTEDRTPIQKIDANNIISFIRQIQRRMFLSPPGTHSHWLPQRNEAGQTGIYEWQGKEAVDDVYIKVASQVVKANGLTAKVEKGTDGHARISMSRADFQKFEKNESLVQGPTPPF